MVLICISLMTSDIKDLFIYVGHLYVFFGKITTKVLCLFLNWIIWFFLAIDLYDFLIYSGYWPLIRYMICKFSIIP